MSGDEDSVFPGEPGNFSSRDLRRDRHGLTLDEWHNAPPEPRELADALFTAPTKRQVVALLRKYQGNVTELARETGRSRTQVYRWLTTYSLNPARFRRSKAKS